VLATGAAFYLVGRSEDRERARERASADRPPGGRLRGPRRPPRRRDHG